MLPYQVFSGAFLFSLNRHRQNAFSEKIIERITAGINVGVIETNMAVGPSVPPIISGSLV